MKCFHKRITVFHGGAWHPVCHRQSHPSPHLPSYQAASELAVKLTEHFECCGKAGNQQKAPFMSVFVNCLRLISSL